MKKSMLFLLALPITSSFAVAKKCPVVNLDPNQSRLNEEYLFVSRKDYNKGRALRCVKECNGFVAFAAFEQNSKKSVNSMASCDSAYNKHAWTHKVLNKNICNNKALSKYYEDYNSLGCASKIHKDFTDALSDMKNLCYTLYKRQASFAEGFATFPGNAAVAVMPNSVHFNKYNKLFPVLEKGMKICKEYEPIKKIEPKSVSAVQG